MALATEDDVAAALGSAPTQDVEFLLEVASDRVIGYLNCSSLPDPVPPAVSRVVAQMVAAALSRAPGVASIAPGDSLSAGGYSASVGDSSAGSVWLTTGHKEQLKPYRCGGVVSVPLQSELYEVEEGS